MLVCYGPFVRDPAVFMKVTYFIEILSSWCHWTEPAWDALRKRYAGKGVAFEWRIALMDARDFPKTRAECDWYYQRSGTITRSTRMLNSAWLEPARNGEYVAPNLVAEAGRDFGCVDDSLRRGLTEAAMFDGRPIGDMAEAVAVGAEITGIKPDELRRAAESPAIRERVDRSTALFRAHQLNQRPSFLIENEIGDKAVLSGIWVEAPVAAAIDAMLADAAGYTVHRAHFGTPPTG